MLNISRSTFLKIITICCILVTLIDVFILHRHSHFSDNGLLSIDGLKGFYAGLSFFGTLLIVYISKIIFKLFSANEDYYNDDF